jgi:hypothetical protein
MLELNNSGLIRPILHLWYSFIPPGEAESQRYKVLQTVTITQNTTKPLFQVGTPLIQWEHPNTGRLRTTSLPVVGNGSLWLNQKRVGYLMTSKPDSGPAIRLEECRSSNDDFIVPAGYCGTTQHSGSMGWIFLTQQPSTLPLYRCYNTGIGYHFASTSSNCDGRGNQEFLLGYIPIK